MHGLRVRHVAEGPTAAGSGRWGAHRVTHGHLVSVTYVGMGMRELTECLSMWGWVSDRTYSDHTALFFAEQRPSLCPPQTV